MTHIPLFATAFRLFFLGAALHAALVILLWGLKLNGYDLVSIQASPVAWHTYEMVFGFCRAAVFGFIFTAGQHWSGKFLLGGSSLLVLFSLWFVGRFAFFVNMPYSTVFFALDNAANLFALWRLRHLLDPQRKQNHGVYYLVAAYAAIQCVAAVTLVKTAWAETYMHWVRLGLLALVMLIAVIAGRILPFFASVVVQGEKPKILPKLEKWILPSGFAALVVYAASPFVPFGEKIAAVVFLLLATLHAVRWFYWRPSGSLRIPILAILYLGYFWLILGFILLAAAIWGWVLLSPAWHMLAIGAAGIFIFGMMTRVALGHTGRPIKASRGVVAAYFALGIALVARVVLPFAGLYREAYAYAAVFWFAAFAYFLAEYGPILVRRRADGKPG